MFDFRRGNLIIIGLCEPSGSERFARVVHVVFKLGVSDSSVTDITELDEVVEKESGFRLDFVVRRVFAVYWALCSWTEFSGTFLADDGVTSLALEWVEGDVIANNAFYFFFKVDVGV